MIFEWNIREAVPPLPFLTVDRSIAAADSAPTVHLPLAGRSESPWFVVVFFPMMRRGLCSERRRHALESSLG